MLSRSLEVELSTIKEFEDLKQSLVSDHIDVPIDVLRRAIVLPKDIDAPSRKYATPHSTLPIKPLLDHDWLRKKALIDGTKLGLTPKEMREREEQKLKEAKERRRARRMMFGT